MMHQNALPGAEDSLTRQLDDNSQARTPDRERDYTTCLAAQGEHHWLVHKHVFGRSTSRVSELSNTTRMDVKLSVHNCYGETTNNYFSPSYTKEEARNGMNFQLEVEDVQDKNSCVKMAQKPCEANSSGVLYLKNTDNAGCRGLLPHPFYNPVYPSQIPEVLSDQVLNSNMDNTGYRRNTSESKSIPSVPKSGVRSSLTTCRRTADQKYSTEFGLSNVSSIAENHCQQEYPGALTMSENVITEICKTESESSDAGSARKDRLTEDKMHISILMEDRDLLSAQSESSNAPQETIQKKCHRLNEQKIDQATNEIPSGSSAHELSVQCNRATQGRATTHQSKKSCHYPWRLKKQRRVYQVLGLVAVYLTFAAIAVQTGYQREPPRKSQGRPHLTPEVHLVKRDAKLHVSQDYMTHDLGIEVVPSDFNSTAAIKGRNNSAKAFCTAHHNMPADFLDPELAHNGGWIIHLLIGFYMFSAVAAACDLYFVPALEHICEDLDLQADVAGATFMAAASSAPEFCTSVIGVFFAKSDVGLGTIVGSSIFNLLAIVAACAIFAGMPVQLSWYPLTRDTSFYILSVSEMAGFMSDSSVSWYEALIMVLTYCCYITLMYFNTRVEDWANGVKDKCGGDNRKRADSLRQTSSVKLQMLNARRKSRIMLAEADDDIALPHSAARELNRIGMSEPEAVQRLKELGEVGHTSSKSSLPKKIPSKVHFPAEEVEKIKSESSNIDTAQEGLGPKTADSRDTVNDAESMHTEEEKKDRVEISEYEDPLQFPEGCLARCYWIIVLPVTLLHAYTIPDSRLLGTWQAKCYLLSFFISVTYIALYSYVMVWMISLAGHVWAIPTTVTGLTILAAGTSVPDCLSSVFVARDGYGDMAVSNAIGSNVFDILLCLGVPWLVDALMRSGHGTPIDSKGMVYAVLTLFGTILYLWCSLLYVDWTLTVKYGAVTLVVYICIVSLCLMIELNVFFELNPAGC